MERADVSFQSDGSRCAAWLYRPAGFAPERGWPCVILAHGFSLIREARLDAYAERFAAAGLASVVFDYRHFGASDGEPRQLLDIGRQLADWRAALAYARALDGVDGERIALWGTSLSGGHVVEVAAGERGVAAVVAQVPFGGLVRRRRPRIAYTARMLRAALRDEARGLLRREPGYIPVVGEPGELAAFTEAEGVAAFRALLPEGTSWENRYTPRVALAISRYKPFAAAGELRCPLLVCVCDDDHVTPPGPALAGAGRAPHAELRRYPTGHFEIYTGDWFERAVNDQTEFLARHLLTPRPQADPGA